MIMQLEETGIYSPEEYLNFEVTSDIRHEYINGAIIPMTGSTPEHNEIASILNAALRIALKGKPYSIFIADQRLWIPAHNIYTYPDVMVVSRPLERQRERPDTITNPTMIAEILSKSTKNYDRDEKFAAYRSISSFQEYLLVDQYSTHVEQYARTAPNQWIFTEYNDLDSTISLSSIPCEIRLADLYEGIELNS